MTEELLPSWRDGAARQAIVDFVERTCGENGVPVEERVAVFDNDGTLWCEKPMPIQLDFILRRFAEMATTQPELRERQPWKAVVRARLRLVRCAHGRALRRGRHQREDVGGGHPRCLRRDQRRGLRGAVGRLHAQRAASDARSRVLGVRLRTDGRAARLPGRQRLLELHRLGRRSRLHAARSARTCTASLASGSSAAAAPSPTPATSDGGTITHKPEADYLDDGPEKPVRIWNRTGRRPLLAAGNSNGDVADARVHPPRRPAHAAPPRPSRRRRA